LLLEGPIPESSLPTAGAPHVLLAEDEPHIRRILITILEGAGFVLEVASDGTEALAAVESPTPFDIILMDVVMPGATGLEILPVIRNLAHRRDTPVIILTAKGQDADRDAALSLGASEFLTKPFSPKKLLQRVDELLAGR